MTPPDQAEPLIRNISDTARWVAYYRAQESARPDAIFRDPFAERLAGDRGRQIAQSMKFQSDNSWSMITRTYLIDRFLAAQLPQGVDMVVNLAAGLDSRPYRLQLPASLQWIEVDLPGILDHKEEILRDEKPVCRLERVRLDLAEAESRRALFQQIAARAKKVLILTEGFLIYLSPEEVASLARDLAAHPNFQSWIIDIASPGLLRMLNRSMGAKLSAAGVPFKFAPRAGPDFFAPLGWKLAGLQSIFKNAARLKRLPLFLRFFALFPQPDQPPASRPWAGVCLLSRSS